MLLSQDWLFQIKFHFHLHRPLDDFKNNSSIPYTKTADTSIVIRIYVVRHKLKHKTISRAVPDGIGSFSRTFFFFFFLKKKFFFFFFFFKKTFVFFFNSLQETLPNKLRNKKSLILHWPFLLVPGSQKS